MSTRLVGNIQEVERIADPNDKEKVFYRIKFSSNPSRDFIEDVYDCWNDPALNPSENHAELLTDYEGNLLIHASAREDAKQLIRLMQDVISSISQRYISGASI